MKLELTLRQRLRLGLLRALSGLLRGIVALVIMFIICGVAYAAVESGKRSPQPPWSLHSWIQWWNADQNAAAIALFTAAGNTVALFFGAFSVFWSRAAKKAEQRHFERLAKMEDALGGRIDVVGGKVDGVKDDTAAIRVGQINITQRIDDLHENVKHGFHSDLLKLSKLERLSELKKELFSLKVNNINEFISENGEDRHKLLQDYISSFNNAFDDAVLIYMKSKPYISPKSVNKFEAAQKDCDVTNEKYVTLVADDQRRAELGAQLYALRTKLIQTINEVLDEEIERLIRLGE